MATETKLLNKGKTPFLKTDFAKMGGTALLTSLIFLTYIYYANIAYPIFPADDGNNLISFTDAQGLIKQYKDDKPLKTLDDSNHVKNLEAFIFSRSVLEDILYKNKLLKAGQKTDSILFYLGQEGTFPDNTDQDHPYPNYKLIAIGMKNKSLLLPKNTSDYSIKEKSSIYDKAKPCPGMGCPPPPPPHE